MGGEENMVGPGPGSASVGNDPFFEGNEVLVHEYGDPEPAAGASPGEPVRPAAATALSGTALRQALTGHELTDGVHWSWKFSPGGRLLSEENGRRKSGRWRVEGDQLCIDSGYGDQCHTVRRQGRSLQLWRDGELAVDARLD